MRAILLCSSLLKQKKIRSWKYTQLVTSCKLILRFLFLVFGGRRWSSEPPRRPFIPVGKCRKAFSFTIIIMASKRFWIYPGIFYTARNRTHYKYYNWQWQNKWMCQKFARISKYLFDLHKSFYLVWVCKLHSIPSLTYGIILVWFLCWWLKCFFPSNCRLLNFRFFISIYFTFIWMIRIIWPQSSF